MAVNREFIHAETKPGFDGRPLSIGDINKLHGSQRYTSDCLPLSLCHALSIPVSLSVCFCLSVLLCLSLCMSLCLSVSLSLSLSVTLSVSISLSIFVCVSVSQNSFRVTLSLCFASACPSQSLCLSLFVRTSIYA